jgi:hypothetical protein
VSGSKGEWELVCLGLGLKFNAKKMLRNLACELNRMKDNLTGDAYRLYPDIWDSAIASGKLYLLEPEQQTKLTNVYRIIKGTDYEAVRVRDANSAFSIKIRVSKTLSVDSSACFGSTVECSRSGVR